MMHLTDFHDYQHRGVEFIKQHPRSMLALEMSLGKTAMALTAISDLIDMAYARGALIVAPRRVAETVWIPETQKWSHLRHLRGCLLRGSNKNKLARNLQRPHHFWVINYESLPWLFTRLNQLFLSQGRYLPFDMIVFDEVTRVKNSTGVRITPWHQRNAVGHKMLDHFLWRIGMTGTPAPNGYFDLFGQYLAIDDGDRLGLSQQIYKEKYFIEAAWTNKKILAEGAKEKIEAKIGDITLSMQTKDYLQLPPVRNNDIMVDLPPKAQAQYDKMETEMFMELDEGGTMEVFNASAMTAKCRQIANGTVIDPENKTHAHAIHDAKLEALDDIIEEAAGQPVFISYVFRADMERIRARYKKLSVAYIGPGVSDNDALKIVNGWNTGLYDILISHHLSAGHGLNLQQGGHQLVWFGLDYPLEGYLQMNARLCRQGQPHPYVTIHRILAKGTLDSVVLSSLESKEEEQQGLMDALKAYRQQKMAAKGVPLGNVVAR